MNRNKSKQRQMKLKIISEVEATAKLLTERMLYVLKENICIIQTTKEKKSYATVASHSHIVEPFICNSK